MRWITRVFVSAAVRRLAVICVLALLGWLGMSGSAHAQACVSTGNNTWANCPDAGAAVSVLASATAPQWSQCNPRNEELEHRPQSLTVSKFVTYGGDGSQALCGWRYPQRIAIATAAYLAECSSRPDLTGSGPWSSWATARNGTTTCDSGCWRSWFDNGDGTMTGKAILGGICPNASKDTCEALGGGMYFNAYLNACDLPEVEECPEGQQKDAQGQCAPSPCPSGMTLGADGTCKNEKNECPAGEVKSPTGACLPGEGQCAAGEARGKDGTCKRDSDGDGTPDNEDDDPSNDDETESFSGGDNCNSPPSCSGSPIMCGQARIQWRIECNTRRNRNITGGTCDAMPICTGDKCDALEYSQLLMQWRSACAAEKLLGLGGGPGAGADPNVARIADALTGNAGNPNLGDDPGPGGAFSDESGYGPDGYPGNGELDDEGFGFSRTCPVIPSVNVFGSTVSFDTSVVCRWLTLGGQLVLVFAGLVSLRIMSGSNT